MIFDLDAKNILEKLSIENCPVGMGGCNSQGPSYDCCEYDITIFDGKKQKESFLESDGTLYHIYHGMLQETSPDILLQYDGMTILLDEQWELRMLLSKIKEKKEQILDRKSTRLNSSHTVISYAVFCLKKKIILRLITKKLK